MWTTSPSDSLRNMALNSYTRSNILILAIVLSTSPIVSASSLSGTVDMTPDRLPRIPDRPLWALSFTADQLDRNLKDIGYSEMVVHTQTSLDDESVPADDSYVLPETD
jgi:hypothetical protein